MRSLLFCVICVICGPVVSASSASQDWPAFRGPGGQGHATDISVQREWSEALNVAWKTAVPGLGWSSPVVAGGKVWLTTAVEQRGISLRLLGFDAATGQELVNVEVFKAFPSGAHVASSVSSAEPTPPARVSVKHLMPTKARILMMLALTRTQQALDIQKIFDSY